MAEMPQIYINFIVFVKFKYGHQFIHFSSSDSFMSLSFTKQQNLKKQIKYKKLQANNFNSMQTNRAVPVQGKVVYYKTDGTGRDSYIKEINGGLLSYDRLHSLKQIQPPRQKGFSFSKSQYNRHPSSYNKKCENKFVHYVSDGSGRDFYVASNQGGNSDPFRWRNETGFKFRNGLRGPDKFLEKNPQQSDVFGKSQLNFTMTQSKFHRSMSMTQTVKNVELSTPKKIPVPPPIDSYFQKGFDASKQFRKHKYGKNH